MHTVTPYTVRCPNPENAHKKKNRNFKLDNIRGNDLYSLLKEFISNNSSRMNKNNEEKDVFYFENLHFNDTKQEVYGYFCYGTFGIKADIKNVDSGVCDFTQTPKHTVIINHFFKCALPHAYDEGMIVFHAYRGNGIKTAFLAAFNEFFLQKKSLRILMNPISNDNVIRKWAAANTKELKATGFKRLTDITDILDRLGHNEQEITIKPQGRGMSFGSFSLFGDPNSELAKTVESLSDLCQEVKAVVEMGGRKRTFRVGKDISNSACQIDVDESVVLIIDGMPDFVTMEMWVSVLMQDLRHNISPPIAGA